LVDGDSQTLRRVKPGPGRRCPHALEDRDALHQRALLVLFEPAPVDAGFDDERVVPVVGDLFDVDGDAGVVGRAGERLLEDPCAA
jgi:hypothetical protein